MLTSLPSTRPHTVKPSYPSPAEATWLQSGRDPWEPAVVDSSGVHTLKFDLCSIPNRRNGSLIETKSKTPSCCLIHLVVASFSHSPAPVFVHISWSSYIYRHTLLIHNGDLNIERSHQPPIVCFPGSTYALTVPNEWSCLFYATVNTWLCVSLHTTELYDYVFACRNALTAQLITYLVVFSLSRRTWHGGWVTELTSTTPMTAHLFICAQLTAICWPI